MTVDRIYDKIVFECDGKDCHESFETETTNWNEAVKMLRAEGWTAQKIGTEWLHLCPDDQEDEDDGCN